MCDKMWCMYVCMFFIVHCTIYDQLNPSFADVGFRVITPQPLTPQALDGSPIINMSTFTLQESYSKKHSPGSPYSPSSLPQSYYSSSPSSSYSSSPSFDRVCVLFDSYVITGIPLNCFLRWSSEINNWSFHLIYLYGFFIKPDFYENYAHSPYCGYFTKVNIASL